MLAKQGTGSHPEALNTRDSGTHESLEYLSSTSVTPHSAIHPVHPPSLFPSNRLVKNSSSTAGKLTKEIGGREGQVMDLLLQRMHRRRGSRSHGIRIRDYRGQAGGAGGRDVPHGPGRQDVLDGEGRRGGGHGGRGARSRELARPESRLVGAQRAPGERLLAYVAIVPPAADAVLLVVALQLLLQALRRIVVKITVPVAGYAGAILKRTRRLRHRGTRSGRVARIGALYHVTGMRCSPAETFPRASITVSKLLFLGIGCWVAIPNALITTTELMALERHP